MGARKNPRGNATNNLVLSTLVAGNAKMFPRILDLYVNPGSTIADVTYGKGVFWRNVPKGRYDVKASDIQTGVDFRSLPYGNNGIDCVILDPPYIQGRSIGTTHLSATAFEDYYKNNASVEVKNSNGHKYHEAVLDLYRDAGKEAYRVLRDRGVLIVKCQDEVCSNRQRFTHVEIMGDYESMGFIAEDLFVVVRSNRPGVSRAIRQVHARKNHSYFLVFWKRGKSKGLWKPPLGWITGHD